MKKVNSFQYNKIILLAIIIVDLARSVMLHIN